MSHSRDINILSVSEIKNDFDCLENNILLFLSMGRLFTTSDVFSEKSPSKEDQQIDERKNLAKQHLEDALDMISKMQDFCRIYEDFCRQYEGKKSKQITVMKEEAVNFVREKARDTMQGVLYHIASVEELLKLSMQSRLHQLDRNLLANEERLKDEEGFIVSDLWELTATYQARFQPRLIDAKGLGERELHKRKIIREWRSHYKTTENEKERKAKTATSKNKKEKKLEIDTSKNVIIEPEKIVPPLKLQSLNELLLKAKEKQKEEIESQNKMLIDFLKADMNSLETEINNNPPRIHVPSKEPLETARQEPKPRIHSRSSHHQKTHKERRHKHEEAADKHTSIPHRPSTRRSGR